MKLRRVLVAMAVATVGVVGTEGATSAAPITRQNFTLTSDISEEGGGTVVASGAINATGDDVVVSDTEDQFVFPNGTLTVIHAPVRSNEHFSDKTCKGSFRETGRYVINEGTGQYEGVTGSGTYRVVGRIQDGCSDPPEGSFTITARGSINLPNP